MLHLQQNLEALSSSQPELVPRITWPVDGSHVLFNGDTPVFYRLHSSLYPLDLCKETCSSLLADVDPSKPFLVLGIGLGEIMDGLLERFPDRPVLAWEKDPWLLRCFLMRKDYSKWLAHRRWRLLLGIDLLPHLPDAPASMPLLHPFLKSVYDNELSWLRTGVGRHRILFNTGDLFVDQVAKALKERGYSLFFLNLKGVSMEEIEYTIGQFKPEWIFSINYQNGLAELCHKFSLPLACWEIDSVLDDLPQTSVVFDKAYIFNYRKKSCEDFRQAGFQRVAYLPLAADPESRFPQTLSARDQALYATPVAFVGNLLLDRALSYKKKLDEAYAAFCRLQALEPLADPFDKILSRQAEDYSTYRLPALFEDHLHAFKEYFVTQVSGTIDPVRLLAEYAAVEKRLKYVTHLADLGIKVWGDAGWRSREIRGMRYMGPAGHHAELNKIYNQALIHLDINRLYQPDMVNMRIFDVLACGGFLLAEYSPALEELFVIGKEIIVYSSLDDLRAKVHYYLNHPEEARAVARRGLHAVRERHTIRQRVQRILQAMQTA